LLNYAKTLTTQQSDGLPYETPLQVAGAYFVCTNIDVQDGLFNGSTGILKKIEYSNTLSGARIPVRCWMDFQNSLVGSEKRNCTRSYQMTKQINLEWTSIDRITRNLSKTERHGGLQIIRKQIPLVAANGMTIAKSQGSSYVLVVAHVEDYTKEGASTSTNRRGPYLSRELLYVACSRATSSTGLYIYGNFHPPAPPPPNDPVTLEMDRLRGIQYPFSLQFLQDYEDDYLKIMFHNVQSFQAHKDDVIADHCAMAR